MKIAFVAPRSFPAIGGMESFLRHVARALAQRHSVLVIAQGLDGDRRGRLADSLRAPAPFAPFADGDVEVRPVRLPLARRALLAPLAAQVIPGLRRHAYGRARLPAARLYARTVAPEIARSARGADVLHMWGGGFLGAATVRAARLLRVPVAVTPFAHRGQWGDDPASAALYQSADRVLALLDVEASLYRELGVDPARIEVCGVCSPGVAPGGGVALRASHGIEGPLVLFLGVRRPYKGFDLLLEAVPIVRERRPDTTFAFVGPGTGLPAAGPGVLDVGEVDEAARAAWLEAADILCLPSQGEIFPVSLLEAWSVGTPVVVSDLETLAELVGKAGGGLTARREPRALADALVSALADPDGLARMGASGKAFWSERHTVPALAALHERVYAGLTGLEETACVA